MQNQNADTNRQHSSPRSLSEILNRSHLLSSSESTSTKNSENSLTITSQKERPAQTGKPLSEHGLNALRNIAASVSKGHLMDDKELGTLLEQHFGPQRYCAKEKVKHVYSENGYDCITEGHEITLDALHNNEMKLFDALEFLNRKATPEFVAGKLAQLRAVMARASESQNDIQLVMATYAEHLQEYPPDIVAYVVDKTIATKKWFPLVSELRKEMETMVSFRRSILNAFERCRNPMLSNKNPVELVDRSQEWRPPTEEEKQAVTDMINGILC